MFARVKHLAELAIFALPLPLAPAVADDENESLNAFLNEIHDARVARWPEWQTSLGFKTNMEEWSDRSDAKMIEEQEITVRDLTRLRREFDPAGSTRRRGSAIACSNAMRSRRSRRLLTVIIAIL